MGQDHARPGGRDGGEPGQQIRLSGMRAETAERVDLRLHRDRLAEDHNFLRPVDQLASERAVALVARNDDVGLRIP